MFEFKILKKNKNLRVGEFTTPHGNLLTPELAFVATEGEIKAIPKDILPTLPINLIIVNTFHLWVKNIVQTLDTRNWNLDNDAGSLKLEKNQASNIKLQNPASNFQHQASKKFTIHNYSNFPRPIMSDSGGFQIFSMGFGKAHGVGKVANMFPGKNIKYSDKNNPLEIDEEGVTFPFNSQKIILTPEKSIQIQEKIGADIMFAFDECTSPLNSKKYTKEAMERTHRWLKRCLLLQSADANLRRLGKSAEGGGTHWSPANSASSDKQALFAIIQGGYYEDLRKISAKFMAKLDLPGFGIGGSLGTTKDEVKSVLKWSIPYLPEEKPKHLLGIGQVRDIFEAVERGVDLFDCVIPTREARHKVVYTKHGKVQLRKMKNSEEVLEKNCQCLAYKNNITMKQLYQLFLIKDPRAFFYATVHNIQFYCDLMKSIRQAIEVNKFTRLKEKYLQYY